MFTAIFLGVFFFIAAFVGILLTASKDNREEIYLDSLGAMFLGVIIGIVVACLLGFVVPRQYVMEDECDLIPVKPNQYLTVIKNSESDYYLYSIGSDGEKMYAVLNGIYSGRVGINETVKMKPVVRKYNVIGKGTWKYFAFIPDEGRVIFFVPPKSYKVYHGADTFK